MEAYSFQRRDSGLIWFLENAARGKKSLWKPLLVNKAGGVEVPLHGVMEGGRGPVTYHTAQLPDEQLSAALFLSPASVTAHAIMAMHRRKRLGNLPPLADDFVVHLRKAKLLLRLLESPYPSWWRSSYIADKAQMASVTLPDVSDFDWNTVPRKICLPQPYVSEVSVSALGSTSSSGSDLNLRLSSPAPTRASIARNRRFFAMADRASKKIESSRARQHLLMSDMANTLLGAGAGALGFARAMEELTVCGVEVVNGGEQQYRMAVQSARDTVLILEHLQARGCHALANVVINEDLAGTLAGCQKLKNSENFTV